MTNSFMLPKCNIPVLILLIILLITFDVCESKNVTRVTLLVNRNDSNTESMEFCADLLTSFVFPTTRSHSHAHVLIDLTPVHSLPTGIVAMVKHLKKLKQRIACLVLKDMLNTTLYYLDPDLFVVNIPDTDPEAYLMDKLLRRGSSLVRLSEVQFERLSKSITPDSVGHMQLYAYQQAVTSYSVARLFFAKLIVYLCGLAALVGGCALVVARQEVLAKKIIVHETLYDKEFNFYIVLFFFVMQAFVLVLLTFYYAKYMIELGLAVFYVLGIVSMVFVGRCLFCARFDRKFAICKMNLRGELREVNLSLSMVVPVPLAIALATIWLWFSHNYVVGLILQCVIAAFIVQFLLSFAIVLRSLKQITIFCLMVMPLEVVHELVLPLLGVANRKPLVASLLTDGLGYFGDSLPGAFLINLRQYSGSNYHNCSYLDHIGHLAIGHVVIPGLICALMMLHDCQQQIRYRRNFSASIFGYCLGLVVTYCVERRLGYAQPALLFLVPTTLLCPVIVSFLFAQWSELGRIWHGTFIDEDQDLDELREKRLSQVSTLSVINKGFSDLD